MLVSLLKFVVPSVEIDVKHDHASGGETGQKKPEKEVDENV
jgi:hypothetical protein